MVTAVIELTENCNMGCTFCLRPHFNKQVMTPDILEKVIRELLRKEKKRVDFIWHGGEPLILGLDFFKKIIEFQLKYNLANVFIINTVQTNSLLLTEEFEEFLSENKFDIGTSIQGTKEIHDKSRVDLGGRGTFDRVINKIDSLARKPSAICVLTKDILGNEEDTYMILKEHSRGARVSEYFPGGKNPNNGKFKDPLMPSPKEYGGSMIKFYEIWKNDSNPINLKPITEIIRAFVRGRSYGCIYSQDVCNKGVIGITENGDFYSCLRAAGRPEFLLGNVNQRPLSNLKKIATRDLNKRLEGLKKEGCLSCEFWNQCNGGCPQESIQIKKAYVHKTYYCEGRKMLFSHIKKDLKRLQNEEKKYILSN